MCEIIIFNRKGSNSQLKTKQGYIFSKFIIYQGGGGLKWKIYTPETKSIILYPIKKFKSLNTSEFQQKLIGNGLEMLLHKIISHGASHLTTNLPFRAGISNFTQVLLFQSSDFLLLVLVLRGLHRMGKKVPIFLSEKKW